MEILFVQAGGSIDKDYPRVRGGYAFEIGEPAVARILEDVAPSFEFDVVSAVRKDSLDMDDADRERILQVCREAPQDRIVVTHGTDTMLETAEILSGIENKTIVLTGAMKPERFARSDAAFNVGSAVGAVSVLDSGVYVAMNGRVFRWDSVVRDEETGRFVDAG